MADRKKSYTPAPEVAPEAAERLRVVLEVAAGQLTVSQGARTLGMSRNHFQTILHRGLAGLAESITPKQAGRPAKPQEVASMEAELERLRQENARLQERVGTTDRLLQAASGLLQGRIRPARAPRTQRTRASGEDKGEPEPERRRRLAVIEDMRRLGLKAPIAAKVAGVHESTVRRWKQHERRGEVRRCARAGDGRLQVAPQAQDHASKLVRDLKGLVGADSLRHSVPGLTRRQAAQVKAEALTAMERERKAGLTRVRVITAGVIRGMDGMYFHSSRGVVHALIAADAAVGFRTSVQVGPRYDAQLVCSTLASDIERYGAPLVYRLDRAKAHEVGAVRELLHEHGVLLLHGPAHCPRYYGQLERKNLEHRAWACEVAQLPLSEIEPCLVRMLHAVNDLWRRRTLDWQTASEVWAARPILDVDRCELRAEVQERAARIGRNLRDRGKPADFAERLAIEQALEHRGYLRQIPGGWC